MRELFYGKGRVSFAQASQDLHRDKKPVSYLVAPDKSVIHKSTGPAAATVLSCKDLDFTDIHSVEAVVPVEASKVPRDGCGKSNRFWQQVVKIAAAMPDGQALKIRLRSYVAYERVRSGLYHAARKLGVGITLTREGNVVYVERAIVVEKVVHSRPMK